MRVYHERLWVPVSWWLLGLAVIVLLGAELAAGFSYLVTWAIFAVLAGGYVAMFACWGLARVEVAGGELRAGKERLPLAAAGQVSALDRAQTRAINGPRADPAAFRQMRPYLRQAVYVEVTDPGIATPYWLVATRHPGELAAAIDRRRPAARADDAIVG
jgi:Protein of unknown function (DUF3093)